MSISPDHAVHKFHSSGGLAEQHVLKSVDYWANLRHTVTNSGLIKRMPPSKPVSYVTFAVIATIGLLVMVGSGASNAQASKVPPAESLRAAQENIRALPYGYTAHCIEWDLKVSSASSATFVFRDSELCKLAVGRLNASQVSPFILCSNDPGQVATVDYPVQKCVDIDLISDDAQEI